MTVFFRCPIPIRTSSWFVSPPHTLSPFAMPWARYVAVLISRNRVVADNLSGDPDVRNYAKCPGKEPSEIYGEWRRGQVEMGVAKNGMTFHFFRRYFREIDSDIYTSLTLGPLRRAFILFFDVSGFKASFGRKRLTDIDRRPVRNSDIQVKNACLSGPIAAWRKYLS
jgi:hypothetical protein